MTIHPQGETPRADTLRPDAVSLEQDLAKDGEGFTASPFQSADVDVGEGEAPASDMELTVENADKVPRRLHVSSAVPSCPLCDAFFRLHSYTMSLVPCDSSVTSAA